MSDPVRVVSLCKNHKRDIITALGYSPMDPWRVALITADILMFQVMTSHDKFWELVGEDTGTGSMSRALEDLGCPGCYDRVAMGRLTKIMEEKGWQFCSQLAQRKVTHPLWPYLEGKTE